MVALQVTCSLAAHTKMFDGDLLLVAIALALVFKHFDNSAAIIATLNFYLSQAFRLFFVPSADSSFFFEIKLFINIYKYYK